MLRLQVVCDACWQPHDRGEHSQVGMAMSAREHAHKEGWTLDELSGVDLCPPCTAARVLR